MVNYSVFHIPFSKVQTQIKRSYILYVFFWVFPRRLIVVCRRFGTLYLFHLHRLDMKYEVWLVRRGRSIYTGDEVYSRWRDQWEGGSR